jgi:hypothetical protein
MAKPDRTYWISKPTCAQAHARAHAPTSTHPSHLPPPPQPHACVHTHRYVILIAFHGNSGFVNAPQCYVTHTLPLLFFIKYTENNR